MKKKSTILTLLVVLLFILLGCKYKGYAGKHPDLFSVAIHSVLWNNGHSFSADFFTDSRIEIVDVDEYGRTLFTFHEDYYKGSDIAFISLIICQKSTGSHVYYYEDINFVILKATIHQPTFDDFDDETVEELKSANDWSQEIQLQKCIEKDIRTKKLDFPSSEEKIRDLIVQEFNLVDQWYNLFIDVLTLDQTNYRYIVYGSIRFQNQENVHFIAIVILSDRGFEEISFLIPCDVYNYQLEFIAFKQANRWNEPIS